VNRKKEWNKRFHISSIWSPNQKDIPIDVKNYIEITRQLLKNKKESVIKKRKFYSIKEFRLMKRLKNNPNIIIKPADKGLGLTILDVKWYLKEGERQLSDVKTYKLVDKKDIPTNNLNQLIVNYVNDNQPYFSNEEFKFLTDKSGTIQIPELYLLPKLHKNPLAGRPIVSSHSWVTTKCSIWINEILKQLAFSRETVVKDTKDMVNIIEKLEIKKCENIMLWTADVTSLYTNIPTSDAIQLIEDLLIEIKFIKREPIIYLLNLVLRNNYFQFNNKYYHQIQGTAMGTSCSVVYAILFMYQLERNIVKKYHNIIILYKRFIDDIFMITQGPVDIVDKFTNEFNNLHHQIKVTWKKSIKEINFLELTIFKGERWINDLKVYQKPLNKFLYLPFSSFYTKSCKTALITGELRRFIRNSSSITDYLETKKLFCIK